MEYLHDDPLAPIYRRWLRRGLATKKVVDILLNHSILARQYNRAASILAGKEQKIISDPGKGDNLPRYVANESVNAPSYVVSKKRSVRYGAYYVCSTFCIDFKAYDICAHTLAVAEMDSSLTEFIKCYIRQLIKGLRK